MARPLSRENWLLLLSSSSRSRSSSSTRSTPRHSPSSRCRRSPSSRWPRAWGSRPSSSPSASAVGSPIHVALFVAPVLVLPSYLIAPTPMDLPFTTLEVVAVGISLWIMSLVAQAGESHWMEVVQLLAVYVILSMAFSWWLPTPVGAHE